MQTETTSSTRPEFVIRHGENGDEGFAAKCWVDTARGSTTATRNVDSGLFNEWHYSVVGNLLSRCQLRIAAPPNDDVGEIYGFVLYEPTAIHMVYVKKTWRKFGIAKRLLGSMLEGDICFSTWSQDVGSWILSKYRNARYVPYWLAPGDKSNG